MDGGTLHGWVELLPQDVGYYKENSPKDFTSPLGFAHAGAPTVSQINACIVPPVGYLPK